jgi:hypothetical protein
VLELQSVSETVLSLILLQARTARPASQVQYIYLTIVYGNYRLRFDSRRSIVHELDTCNLQPFDLCIVVVRNHLHLITVAIQYCSLPCWAICVHRCTLCPPPATRLDIVMKCLDSSTVLVDTLPINTRTGGMTWQPCSTSTGT